MQVTGSFKTLYPIHQTTMRQAEENTVIFMFTAMIISNLKKQY